jgi:hypothetical protein
MMKQTRKMLLLLALLIPAGAMAQTRAGDSSPTGTLVLKTTKDIWTYQGTVSAGSDNKVAVEVDL